MDKLNEKVLKFAAALQDMYKDEEEREAINFSKLELREEELTEDFTAMLLAVFFLYKDVTADDTDFLGFTHVANRLAVQYLLEKKEESC